MKNILVYEDGNVNEYELCYDQESMDFCLEEYKRTFSLLRKGKCIIDKKSLKNNFNYIIGGIDAFVSLRVICGENDNFYDVSYIGAINPLVYTILNKNGSFCLDNSKICDLYTWYLAIKDSPDTEKRDLTLASSDYFNLNDKVEIRKNISCLLSGLSLSYVGNKDNCIEEDIKVSKRNAVFVEEFGIKKEFVKKLKK